MSYNYRDSAKEFFNSATGEDHKAWADAAAAYFRSLSGKDKRSFVDAFNVYYAGLNDGSIAKPVTPTDTEVVLKNGSSVTVKDSEKAENGATAEVADGKITDVSLPATTGLVKNGATYTTTSGTVTVTVASGKVTMAYTANA